MLPVGVEDGFTSRDQSGEELTIGSIPSVKALMLSSSSPTTSWCPSVDAPRLRTELMTAIVPHDWLLTWLQKNPGKSESYVNPYEKRISEAREEG